MTIILAMLYGSECLQMMKVQANMMKVVKMRMLRWTCGRTLLDMILNKVLRAELEVASITNNIRE